MTKINGKLNKRPVKRLQAGPKLADSSNLQLDKGIALEKLVGRLVGESMEVTMSKAKERYLRNENRKKTTGNKVSSPEEECLGMLETMKVTEKIPESVQMEDQEPEVKDTPKDD